MFSSHRPRAVRMLASAAALLASCGSAAIGVAGPAAADPLPPPISTIPRVVVSNTGQQGSVNAGGKTLPGPSEATGFQTLPYVYYLNPTGYSIKIHNDSESLRAVTQYAASRLQAITGIRFEVLPQTFTGAWPTASETGVINVSREGGACDDIATLWVGCTKTYASWTVVQSASVKLNPAYVDGYTTNQRTAAVLHELGHAVGLAHVNDTGQVMYGTAADAGAELTDYQWGDQNGLRWLAEGSVAPPPPPPPPPTDFVQLPNHQTFRIVGGAPLYVGSWAFNNNVVPPITQVPNLSAYRQYPEDGALVSAAGTVYEFVGGAPVWVSDTNIFPGRKISPIDPAVIQLANSDGAAPYNHVRRYPADGTLVVATTTYAVYEFVGGAPLWISDMGLFQGAAAPFVVDIQSLRNVEVAPRDHVRQYPLDGTFVSSAQTSAIYHFAGGAPLYVANMENFRTAPAPAPLPVPTRIDGTVIDNANRAEPNDHVLAYPKDGTFIQARPTNNLYRFAGGAPLYVPDPTIYPTTTRWIWTDASNIPSTLTQDKPAPYNHVHRYPEDGTFLRAPSGTVYRVAGGAPVALSSPAPWGGGALPYTDVPATVFTSFLVTGERNDLREEPRDGTLLQGSPSGLTYAIASGLLAAPPANPTGAVLVNDSSLDLFKRFTDVGATSPFYLDIDWMATRGITTGNANGTFSPTGNVSRQDMAAFLYRYANPGAAKPTCQTPPFPDVLVSNPFCGEIAAMANAGIITGYGDGKFYPGNDTTRQATAAFLYRLKGRPLGTNPPCTNPFPDVNSTVPFCGEISWMVNKGIATGYSDGYFHAADPVTRQAMAAFLHRLYVLP